eukprot:TRINITY_DN69523_c0_g1_i1.p1 TRINITY_DN69523_c0_g1~~TRINITY_DN69523_c0_g1_i1.p1  ORF type:complete len:482 (+),score=82.35 TRINITY_DN69523_c0_g1_i1:102-1547(+)
MWNRGISPKRFVKLCVVLVLPFALTSVSASPCSDADLYKDWLSHPSVFLRKDQPKGLQGLHVACLWRKQGQDSHDGEYQLEAYRDALETNAPEMHTLPGSAGESWSAFRDALSNALRVRKETSNWGHWESKQVFGVFSSEAARLHSVAGALDSRLIFVIVGGQWFWPPVREGYVRQVKGQDMVLETLSVSPVVFKVGGFLKTAECEEIIRLGENRMENSPVSLMDKDKGKAAKEFRTSSQARVELEESSTLRSIDERVGKLTGVPHEHNEEVQILKYDKTQYYSAHLDNWDPKYYSDSSWFEYGHNNRYITVFWYLTTVDEGGETLFPRAFGLPQPRDMWSCEKGLKVKPVQGTVIFWYSLHPNGNTDENGLHAACPVESGQKWSANYWVWNKPKRVPSEGDDFAERRILAEARSAGQQKKVSDKEAQNDVEILSKEPSSTSIFAIALMVPVVAGLGLMARHLRSHVGKKDKSARKIKKHG